MNKWLKDKISNFKNYKKKKERLIAMIHIIRQLFGKVR